MQVMAGARHGGAEAFFERLVAALYRAGVEQQVVIRQDPDRANRLRAAGLTPIELPFAGRLDMTTRRAIRRAAVDFQPDILLTWMNRAARFARPGPHVLAGRFGGYYDLKYYRHYEHLIGNTQDIRKYLIRQGCPAERAWYLPNFVDAEPAQPLDRQTLGTPADAPLLLALGRLHENKGFDVLLAALTDIPGAWLWLAGDGPLDTMLQREAQRCGVAERVRFLGWRDDIGALFAAADVFVCPSRHEPLGNVVIEAWAHKCPVVATAALGPNALIGHGESGLLAPVDDAPALAAEIRRVLANTALATDLVEGGYAAYQADFTEQAVVAKYREFFDAVKP
jgi:glycosyltransferase involved in cell wall biosynthesis